MTKEQLKELEELSGALMPLEQIAKIISIPLQALMGQLEDEESEAYKAYFKGSLLTIAANNTKIISLAKQGSSPAQMMVKKMEQEATLRQIENGYK